MSTTQLYETLWKMEIKTCTELMTMKVHYILFPGLRSSIFRKVCHVNKMYCHRRLSRSCHPPQLLWNIQGVANRKRAFFTGFLPKQLEAIIWADAESRLKGNSAHYWFISSDRVLSGAALTPPEHRDVSELERFLIRGAMRDLLASFNASARTSFQARRSKGQTKFCFMILV